MNLLTAVAFPRVHRGPIPPSPDWTYVDFNHGWQTINSIINDGTNWITVGIYSANLGSGYQLFNATDPSGTWSHNNIWGDHATESPYDIAYDGSTYYVSVGKYLTPSTHSELRSATSISGTWTSRLSDTSKSFETVAYNGTHWVAAGGGGQLYTATNPTSTWTSRTPGFGTSSIYSVAWDGTYWVAAGASGKLFTATDPTSTWTSRTPGFGTSSIYSVAWDGTHWVAVGASGKLYTATNPTSTWSAATSGFDTSTIYGVANNGGTKWVAVGSSGKLFSASDPTSTWTQENSNFGTGTISCIAYDSSHATWVAGGSHGISYYVEGM